MDMFQGRPNRDSEIILVGRSNVGKSTLMRKITGHAFRTGKKPGVTRKPNFYDFSAHNFLITDLPGFGFMSGVENTYRETIKTDVVQYIESNSNSILAAILVIDGNSAIEIIDRHVSRGDVPHDIDFYNFLIDLEIPTILAINKIDKINNLDATLDDISTSFGLPSPWQQWSDIIAPICAKKDDLSSLLSILRTILHDAKHDDFLQYFK